MCLNENVFLNSKVKHKNEVRLRNHSKINAGFPVLEKICALEKELWHYDEDKHNFKENYRLLLVY